MTRQRRLAVYLQSLVHVDEPQLILLESNDSKVVAVAVFSGDGRFPFLAAVVSQRQWDKYVRGMVDLRYLFTYARKDNLYVFDFLQQAEDGRLTLDPIDEKDVPADWYPDPQFFSRDHTEALKNAPLELTGEQEFEIDGSWALPDFGQFYSRISAVYVFLLSLRKFDDTSVPEALKSDIQKAFSNHPFRGGSSYGQFYSDLIDSLPIPEQPGVRRVQYASPGTIAIKGMPGILKQVHAAITNFQENYHSLRSAYGGAHEHLRKLGYLRMAPGEFQNDTPTAVTIMSEAESLAAKLGLEHMKAIQKLCSGNALVVSKVVLSYYRRVEGAFHFFAEGRATFPNR